jgi:hypothetical protein
MPKLESGDLSKDWRDWIIAHALLKEAATIMDETSVAGKTSASK